MPLGHAGEVDLGDACAEMGAALKDASAVRRPSKDDIRLAQQRAEVQRLHTRYGVITPPPKAVLETAG